VRVWLASCPGKSQEKACVEDTQDFHGVPLLLVENPVSSIRQRISGYKIVDFSDTDQEVF